MGMNEQVTLAIERNLFADGNSQGANRNEGILPFVKGMINETTCWGNNGFTQE